mgnify:CR=1 FL=1
MTEVKIINNSNNPLPKYQTGQSAGMDLYAFLKDEISLHPGERTLVPTGIHIELPSGFEAQIRPRSGLAFKYGIGMVNAPGTIDADYRGDIGVLLVNHGQEAFVIKSGERIAQMVIAKFEQVTWVQTEELNSTERGSGGFGHTGK